MLTPIALLISLAFLMPQVDALAGTIPGTACMLPRNFQPQLRVDHLLHTELKMLVPKEMCEDFFVLSGRGAGEAMYSNYRQFSTTRIVPQR